MTKTIDYGINPIITWTTTDDGTPQGRQAYGSWRDWEFTVSSNPRGGWNVKINGEQAWTHMRGFHEAQGSIRDRLRDWAYMDQFR